MENKASLISSVMIHDSKNRGNVRRNPAREKTGSVL
jgi:hypothetical protein